MRCGSVYIVTDRPNGILYLGVMSHLGQRIWQHLTGVYRGFSGRYGLTRLGWSEPHGEIRTAIQRQHTMKHWSRAWKARSILDMNTGWSDLFDTLNA